MAPRRSPIDRKRVRVSELSCFRYLPHSGDPWQNLLEDARLAKAKAEKDAREAEEQRKVRSACSVLYQGTAEKKIGDLTVREEQQVRACQALGQYPPN
jgi:hypothetical protein